LKRLAELIAYLVVRRKWSVIGVMVLLLGASAWLLTRQQAFDSEVLNLLPPDSEAVKALKIFNSDFRQGRELIVALHGSPEAISDHEDVFVEELRKEPWVQRVFNGPPLESQEEMVAFQRLMPQLLLNLQGDSFGGLISSLQPDAIAAHVKRMREMIDLGSPLAEGTAGFDPLGLLAIAMRPLTGMAGMDQSQSLTSPDGTLRLFPLVTTQKSLEANDCKAVMIQVEAFKARMAQMPGFTPEILVTGRTAYVAQIGDSMQRDITLTSVLSFIAVTGLFFVAFRRLVPPLCTSLILGCACFVCFAAGLLIFDNLNMIAIAFCSILVGMGDDFSLLLYNRYLLARSHREEHQVAVATAIREMGRGILYAAVTTGAGFLVLLFSRSAGFAQLGVLIAIGIVGCAVFVIVLLFLFIGPTHSHPERPDPLHGMFDGLSRLLLRRRALLVLIGGGMALAAIALSVLPVAPLHFDTNPRSLEPHDIPASKALRVIREKIPAATEPIVVLVDAPDSQAAHDRWAKVDARLKELVQDGPLASYTGPAGFMVSPERLREHRAELAHKANIDASRAAFVEALTTNGFKADSPDFQPTVALLDELKRSLGAKSDRLETESVLPPTSSWWFILDRYLAPNSLRAAAFLQPKTPITTPAQAEALEKELHATGVPLAVTGWTYTMVGLVPWARGELVFFSAAVSILIVISMALAYRHWKPLVVHAVSLISALAGLIVLLKFTGIPINMLNALAFPLVIGVGVDYGMHLLLALTESGDAPENLRTVVKPLVISGLTTIAGFGSLVFALNPALKGLGQVCTLGVTSCLVTSVFLAVPLLALLGVEQRAHGPS
jgi:predicted RND superfamily exporter protein